MIPITAARDLVEGDQLAFAAQGASLGRLAESLVALANARGGTLLVGVDPRTGQAEGLVDPAQALDRVLQAALSTDPPLIIPLPEAVGSESGATVLHVTVPPGLPHVYSYQGKYLTREGHRNRPIPEDRLRQLIMERSAAGFEAQVPDGACLADLNWDKVERFLPRLGPLASGSAEQALLRRGCLSLVEGSLRPTVAGLLLFGNEPQRWVRSACILVARYAGAEMDDRFIKEEIRGTLPDQIRQAEAFAVGNMRRTVRLAGLDRFDEPEYPVEAVREVIVNAVAHRDYQIRGDEIRLLMFSDRIECYSPGRLPGHITLDNLLHERFSRNEIIVQVLSDLGFIERLGYGIDRMVRLVADAGLRAPRFEEKAAGFQVTLYGRQTGALLQPVRSGRWRHLGLNERQELALRYLAERGRITNREYQEQCPDVSAETIRRDLADLVSRGLLLKIGEKRATYYILKWTEE